MACMESQERINGLEIFTLSQVEASHLNNWRQHFWGVSFCTRTHCRLSESIFSEQTESHLKTLNDQLLWTGLLPRCALWNFVLYYCLVHVA